MGTLNILFMIVMMVLLAVDAIWRSYYFSRWYSAALVSAWLALQLMAMVWEVKTALAVAEIPEAPEDGKWAIGALTSLHPAVLDASAEATGRGAGDWVPLASKGWPAGLIMFSYFFMVDFHANTIVFSEPHPSPERYQGVLAFVNKKIKFNKLKVTERLEKDFEKEHVYFQKLSDQILVGCFAVVEPNKRRFVYQLMEGIFDKAEDSFKDLNKNADYRKLVQKDIDDFVKGKNDTIKKISRVADKIEQQTQAQIQRELDKANQLLRIKTDMEEANEIAKDNAAQAQAIKREAWIMNLKMYLFLYGTTAAIVVGGLFVFWRFFLR